MTFRVILRKDVIYKNNTGPLCLLFFHDNRKKSVGLGVSVVRSCWDAQAQKVTDDCPDRDDIQFQITAKIKEYEKKIKKLEALEIPVTFEALFETIGKRMDCTVGYYFRQIIDRLEKVEKYGSASKHKVTLALMSQFRSVNMRFDELDLTCLREFEIFLSQKGNVNNSCNYAAFQYWQLYLIEILHQTTTCGKCEDCLRRCILLKFYIKPQLRSITSSSVSSCILLKFYIKPQPSIRRLYLSRLYLIEILHQTTTTLVANGDFSSCILLKFYIKPQHETCSRNAVAVVSYWNSTSNHNSRAASSISAGVVSYWNSTSNHNTFLLIGVVFAVVSYWNSTSNHNYIRSHGLPLGLYLIEILHQTTTCRCMAWRLSRCILLKFYIKPQLYEANKSNGKRCILLKFYIKPQPGAKIKRDFRVVSYWNSTSNHNIWSFLFTRPAVVSYWNSTSNHNNYNYNICDPVVVSYWNSTSNHNYKDPITGVELLYLIEILHQTTTSPWGSYPCRRCILLKFYIKPQLVRGCE